MPKMKSCSCGWREKTKNGQRPRIPFENGITLADVPVGSTATIAKLMPEMRERKKFADVGLIAGTELRMEAHAPFGGLLRVKVMETSMVLHRDDAVHIVMKEECE